eukprot:m.157035 g.157035  ORF g.157035 m.157035 type:complete len:78 (-) comp16449_c0_seq11:498-731(-)
MESARWPWSCSPFQHEDICRPLLDCLHHLTGAAVEAYTKLGLLQQQRKGDGDCEKEVIELEGEVAVSVNETRGCCQI